MNHYQTNFQIFPNCSYFNWDYMLVFFVLCVYIYIYYIYTVNVEITQRTCTLFSLFFSSLYYLSMRQFPGKVHWVFIKASAGPVLRTCVPVYICVFIQRRSGSETRKCYLFGIAALLGALNASPCLPSLSFLAHECAISAER